MSTSSGKFEYLQFVVICLFVYQQPIRPDMTFPIADIISSQGMVFILFRGNGPSDVKRSSECVNNLSLTTPKVSTILRESQVLHYRVLKMGRTFSPFHFPDSSI